MKRIILGAIAALLIAFFVPVTAQAQSPCPYIAPGAVLTSAQWQSCFSGKQDALGFTPISPANIVGIAPVTATPVGSIVNVGIANGTSVANPGTGTLEDLVPSQTVTGASKTYATADLWKRTRRSNSGSAMTDTLPASSATGMVNGTRIEIKNVDATASDTISAGAGTTIIGGASFVLVPSRDLELTYDAPNTTWRAEANTDTAVLTTSAPLGGLPLYVAPTATGTGTCLSSGDACTLATACSFVKQIATFLGVAGPINLANGTYNTLDANSALCSVLGNGGGSASQLLSITGNTLSPTSVVLAVPNNSLGIYAKDGGEAAVSGFEVTLGSGATGIQNAGQGAVVDYGNVVWGASGSNSVHVSGASGSYINLSGAGETIAANFNHHWDFSGDAQFSAGGVTAISNSTTFSLFLNEAGAGWYANLSAWSFTGTSLTGTRANLYGPGYMVTPANAPCVSALPGNGGCSFNLAAQDLAGDGMSGTGIVVGKQQPTINDPIVGPQLYSSLPASPTAGQIDHIIDGNASNCSDGACTTPGATVTLGGGSLDLLIGYDGAAWRIFRAQAVPALANLSGILAANKGGTGVATASATTFFSGPGSGSAAAPAFRVIVGTDLPLPGSSSLGGVESYTAPSHQWINSISSVTGAPSSTQPVFTDISGNATVAQGGTGNVTATAHSIPVSEGTSAQNAVGPCTTSQMLVGGGASADPTCGNLSATPYYLSGNWYVPFGTVTSGNGSALTANTIYCVYGYVPQAVTIKSLGAFLQTGILTDTTQFAIYSQSAGTLTLVDSTGNITAGTAQSGTAINGALTNTTDTLVPGKLYAFCQNSAGAMIFVATESNNLVPGATIGSATQSNVINVAASQIEGRSIAQTYASGWPSTITESSMADVIGPVPPVIGFQVN